MKHVSSPLSPKDPSRIKIAPFGNDALCVCVCFVCVFVVCFVCFVCVCFVCVCLCVCVFVCMWVFVCVCVFVFCVCVCCVWCVVCVCCVCVFVVCVFVCVCVCCVCVLCVCGCLLCVCVCLCVLCVGGCLCLCILCVRRLFREGNAMGFAIGMQKNAVGVEVEGTRNHGLSEPHTRQAREENPRKEKPGEKTRRRICLGEIGLTRRRGR